MISSPCSGCAGFRWHAESDNTIRHTSQFFYDDLSKPLITAEGANMHNDFQHYLKLGLYRHLGIQTNNSIFLDDLKITLEMEWAALAMLGFKENHGQYSKTRILHQGFDHWPTCLWPCQATSPTPSRRG